MDYLEHTTKVYICKGHGNHILAPFKQQENEKTALDELNGLLQVCHFASAARRLCKVYYFPVCACLLELEVLREKCMKNDKRWQRIADDEFNAMDADEQASWSELRDRVM